MRNNSDCIADRIGDARLHLRLLPLCMQISRSKAFASPTGTEIELAILVAGQIVKVMGNSVDGSFLRIVDSSTLCLCKESHTDRSQKDSGVCQCVPLFWSQGGRHLLCRRLRGRRGRRTLTLTWSPYLLLPFFAVSTASPSRLFPVASRRLRKEVPSLHPRPQRPSPNLS